MYIIYVSVLFTGDNVDHTILTIDRNGTSHGMGIIAALTPRKQLGIVVPLAAEMSKNILKLGLWIIDSETMLNKV